MKSKSAAVVVEFEVKPKMTIEPEHDHDKKKNELTKAVSKKNNSPQELVVHGQPEDVDNADVRDVVVVDAAADRKIE